jgi:hypothetical protein
MENYDQLILDTRQKKYYRDDTFKKMITKHFHNKCLCKKTGKICIYNGNIDLSRLSDITYIDSISTQLETLYNLSQSITQSMRATAGKTLELIIEDIFIDLGINFGKQIFISNDGFFYDRKYANMDGHKVDFTIPSPKFGTHYSTFDGEIISVKTSTRERYLQDIYLDRITVISLENCNHLNVKSIKIDPVDQNFTRWITDLKIKF